MEEIRQENKMGTMKIPKLLFSISIPIIISMLVQALYNIVDAVFVGRYDQLQTDANSLIGTDSVAGTTALGFAFPVQMLMIAVATGLGVGMNALLSRALGQKDKKRADLIAGQGMFLVGAAYILFLAFGLFFTDFFVSVQSTDGSLAYQYGVDYISIVSIFSIGVFVQVTMERLLQATGKSMLSMVTQLSGAITNIILDPILIFGYLGAPEMGIKGAAIATVIGQAVAAITGIILNLAANKEITLILKNFLPKGKVLGEILVIGIPAVLMQAISSVMSFTMNIILKPFDAVAVFAVYFKLQSFVFMPVFGLNNGMIPIIAYNYGAKKKDRIYATMKLSAISAVAYMLLGFAIFQIFPAELLGIFNDSMTEIGVPALRIISISFMLAGFSIVSISTCQALGKSIYSLVVSVIRQLVMLIPAAYLLSLAGNVDAIWWAFPIAELVGCTSCIIFVIHVLKNTIGKKEFSELK